MTTRVGCARCGASDHCACYHAACCYCGSKNHITPCGEHPPVQADVEHGDCCATCAPPKPRTARDDIIDAVHEGYECLDWAPADAEIDELLDRHVAEVLAGRGDRQRIIGEVTSWLRRTPHYDKDYPALLRAARRIEEWVSQ